MHLAQLDLSSVPRPPWPYGSGAPCSLDLPIVAIAEKTVCAVRYALLRVLRFVSWHRSLGFAARRPIGPPGCFAWALFRLVSRHCANSPRRVSQTRKTATHRPLWRGEFTRPSVFGSPKRGTATSLARYFGAPLEDFIRKHFGGEESEAGSDEDALASVSLDAVLLNLRKLDRVAVESKRGTFFEELGYDDESEWPEEEEGEDYFPTFEPELEGASAEDG